MVSIFSYINLGMVLPEMRKLIAISRWRRYGWRCSWELGEKCDVNRMIDTYLETEAKERNTSFEEELLVHESGQAERQEHYDINRMDGLQFYETGSTITPGIKKEIGKLIRFSEDTLKEDTYKKLMEEKPQKRKEWMIRQNRSILIRDKDWEKIFFGY